jgi:hypothetical protein
MAAMVEPPHDSLVELAQIFAAAILRLRARQALPKSTGHAAPANNFPESSAARLEVSPDTALSVHTG